MVGEQPVGEDEKQQVNDGNMAIENEHAVAAGKAKLAKAGGECKRNPSDRLWFHYLTSSRLSHTID
ncbi:UNVERIFIED_CONTAM: hypothetical protein Slati_3617600 [Sesamum latifolium]|uniref:Uncharacterized protein n=1 Tax=Sesamum latifolium TaxID=2727402 RepID=A0AAW2U0C3_9LAMI